MEDSFRRPVSRWHNILNKEQQRILNTKRGLQLKALLCGLLAGDGCLQIRRDNSGNIHHDIRFFPDDKLMKNTYIKSVKEVYGKDTRISKKGTISCVRLLSKTVIDDLLSYATFGIYSWNLPFKLFTTGGAKEAWLRGFFSADGYVGPRSIKVQTVNHEGMKQVSSLLSELGIEHGFYQYIPKKKNYSKVSIIMIQKAESRSLFYRKVGFCHNKKTNALKESLKLI